MTAQPPLNRRERQILDVLYRLGHATAQEVTRGMDDAPTNTTVRTLLRILVAKKQVAVTRDGARYVYRPVASRDRVGKSMMQYVVQTFFGGSAEAAMAALLGKQSHLDEKELERIEELIAQHRRESL